MANLCESIRNTLYFIIEPVTGNNTINNTNKLFNLFQEYLEAKVVQLESELVAERRSAQRERTLNAKLQKQLARVSKRGKKE